MEDSSRREFPFSIGCNILEGPLPRLERMHLAAIREAGAECYELHLGYRFGPGDDNEPWRVTACFVDLRDDAFLDQVTQWQGELGLRAGQMHAPCNGGIFDYAALDEVTRRLASDLLGAAARAAGHLAIPFVVVHPRLADGARYGCGKAPILAQLRRTIEERLDEFIAVQSAMALENLPLVWAPCGVGIADLVAVCEEFDSPALGICLDTGHARLDGWQPAEAVRACGQWLRCLHTHDNHGQGDEHLLPFDGEADWSGFVSALHEVGYRGTLNLEVVYDPYRDTYHSPGEMIQEAIQRVDALYEL